MAGKNGHKNGFVEEEDEEEERPNLCRRLINFVTVEPLLACYVLPSITAALAIQNLNLEKSCRVNMHYNDSVCDKLIASETDNLTTEVENVQTLVANMVAWKTPLQTFIPAILILFLGAWCDRTGRRKPCMLFPMVGELLTSVGLILCTYYFVEWPLQTAGLIEALPPALTGGWSTMFMAIFSYIASVSSEEDRIFRIGVLNIFVTLSAPIGTAVSGILTKEAGFYGTFGLSIALYTIGIVYGLIRIRDDPKPKDPLRDRSACAEFFNPKHVVDTFMVAFKAREGNRRLRIFLLLLMFIVLAGPIYGEVQVAYLYTRYKFNFTEVDYSILAAYSSVIGIIGTIVTITVFSKLLKLDDTLIGIIGVVSKIAGGIVFTFASNKTWLYIAPLFDIFSGASMTALRSIATKYVDPDEVGKIGSLLGVTEAVVPLIYSPMYSAVYVATLQTLPGAFFLLGCALTVPAGILFFWMYYLQKQDKQLASKIAVKEMHAYDNEVTSM